jgi:hypothetical protein
MEIQSFTSPRSERKTEEKGPTTPESRTSTVVSTAPKKKQRVSDETGGTKLTYHVDMDPMVDDKPYKSVEEINGVLSEYYNRINDGPSKGDTLQISYMCIE